MCETTEICLKEMHLEVFCFSENCNFLALFQHHEPCMINSSARSHALFHFQEVPYSRAENQSSFSQGTRCLLAAYCPRFTVVFPEYTMGGVTLPCYLLAVPIQDSTSWSGAKPCQGTQSEE